MKVQPFKLAIADEVLNDLRLRAENIRWPGEMPGLGWDKGSNLDYLTELLEYWRIGFDWLTRQNPIFRVRAIGYHARTRLATFSNSAMASFSDAVATLTTAASAPASSKAFNASRSVGAVYART